MAFLDNNGNILLDAVLTDAGRERLARGDGSFKVVRFALSDDEINYGLWNKVSNPTSPTADIEKTPIFEAWTESNVSQRNLLVTYTSGPYKSKTDPDDPGTHLYLPVLRINTNSSDAASGAGKPMTSDGHYVVVCTSTAYQKYDNLAWPTGYINGSDTESFKNQGSLIHLEHGIDQNVYTVEYNKALLPELTEQNYNVFLDIRYGRVVDMAGKVVDYISVDDSVAHYYVGEVNIDEKELSNSYWFVQSIESATTDANASIIAGSRAAQKLSIGIAASNDLGVSTDLFTKFGYTISNFFPDSTDALAIDTTARVVGVKTGISVDIPIRFIREP